MKYHMLALLMASLLCINIDRHVQAQCLTWDFVRVTYDSKDNKQEDIITYSVNSTKSKIEYKNEIIFIDYNNSTLYRYNKLKNFCDEFRLSSNKTNEFSDTLKNPGTRSILLVSSLKVLTAKEHKKIATYNCTIKHIIFGADLTPSQVISPIKVNKLGQNFTENMISYYVSEEMAGFSTLLAIAERRSDILKNNPLLRQMDIVGLLDILGGFPVQIVSKLHDTTSITTLVEGVKQADNDKLLLPDECRHPILDMGMGLNANNPRLNLSIFNVL